MDTGMDIRFNRRLISLISAAIILFALAAVVPRLILNNTSYVPLENASRFGGIISQAIGLDTSGTLQTEGRDFKLQDTHYFDDDTWAISTIHSLRDRGDAYVILKKQSQTYTVVLGPGTTFSRDYTKSMPVDLTNYLDDKGILYGAS